MPEIKSFLLKLLFIRRKLQAAVIPSEIRVQFMRRKVVVCF